MLVPTSAVPLPDHSGRWAVLAPSGEVDLALAPVLREAIDALVAEDRVWIVLDMTLVSFLDSAGLGVVVYGMRRVERRRGSLRLAGAGAQVRRLLELTGLDGAFEAFPDVEAARGRGIG
ncbi:STAS domain-containing protein [Amycolatopsis minnesotensis]|uniref:Anti-sigma factor antagonist n=1 Tax=Amycolatopsis minnesotensis TaxID=337894 RepID=A0ABP5BH75_9PSEU